ncbi:MAG: T9SS type A sorting domain-containing protein [Chitinophagales bacterium]|nr:T9SS type A sorting domain-containing protein [Chitinophagales bacterium]
MKIYRIIILFIISQFTCFFTSMGQFFEWGSLLKHNIVELKDVASNQYGDNFYVGQSSITGMVTYQNYVSGNVVSFYGPGGNKRPLIMKIAEDGNLVWYKYLQTSNFFSEYTSTSVAVNQDDDVYVSTHTGDNNNEIGGRSYLNKLDSDGNEIWEVLITESRIHEIDLDQIGNVIVAGSFYSTSTIYATNQNIQNTAIGVDGFIAKFNPQGEFMWIKSLRSSLTNDVSIIDNISISSNGDINATGRFKSTIDFDPGIDTFNMTGNSNSSIYYPETFILKLNSAGDFLWAKEINSLGKVYPTGIVSTDNNGTIICGNFLGYTDLDPGTALLNTNGSFDMFVMRLDDNGDLVWVHDISGYGENEMVQMAIGENDNLYFTGTFFGSLDLNPGLGINAFNSGNSSYSDVFVVSLDSAGNYLWARILKSGSIQTNDEAYVLGLNQDGNILLCGTIAAGADLDPGPGETPAYSLGYKYFIKLSPDSCVSMALVVEDINEVNCVSDGQIVATTINPKGPVEYYWDYSSTPNDSFLTVFTEGFHHLEVIDSVGCSRSTSVYVEGPSVIGSFELISSIYSSSTTFRPGLSYEITANSCNSSCTPVSGQFLVVLDELMNYQSSTITPDSIAGDSLFWNFTNLDYDSGCITPVITVIMDSTFNTNSISCIKAVSAPFAGDYNSFNNTSINCYGWMNSLDPNNKQVIPNGECDNHLVIKDDPLNYIINFQNIGNAEAIDVRIVDTIDTDLDIASFLLVDKSHEDLIIELVSDSIIIFRFDSILLPNSANSPILSKGYVNYQIYPKSGLNNGTIVDNDALIFFDYNYPIKTNSVFNTLIDVIPDPDTSVVISLYCDSAIINQQVFYADDTIFTILKSNFGCDSILETHLVINNSIQTNALQIEACDSALVGGTWFYSSQTIYDTLSTLNGCDSVVQTDITIYNSVVQNELVTACDSTQINGNWYLTSQLVRDTFQTINSCDSIINTDLTIHYSTFETQIETACDSLEIFGDWFYSSQTIYDTLSTSNGCDSVVQTDITIYNSVIQNETVTECDSAQINDNWYLASQFIRDTFQTVNGCDSIINTDLTIHYSTFETQIETACDSIYFMGNWYTSSQNLVQSFTTPNGCDSVLNTILTINNGTFKTEQIEACDSVAVNGILYFLSQSIYDTLLSINGCDSIVKYDIFIDNSFTISIFDTILNTETYTLPNGTVVNQTGIYYDTLQTINNCDSVIITHLFVKDNVGIININPSDLSWTIYPNPTSNSFTLELNEDEKDYTVQISNTLGQIIYTGNITDRKNNISTVDWTSGIYNLTIKDKTGMLISNKKVVISKDF